MRSFTNNFQLAANGQTTALGNGASISGNNIALCSVDGDITNTGRLDVSGGTLIPQSANLSGNEVSLTTTTLAMENSGIDLGSDFDIADNLTITSNANLSLSGANLSAGGDIALAALGGDIDISSAQDRLYDCHGIGRGWQRDESIVQQGSTLDATGSLTLSASRDIEIVTSLLQAGNLLLTSALSSSQNSSENSSVGGFAGISISPTGISPIGNLNASFANRIGERTWQTVITNEGLLAVRKLLRKTASKSTVVSCHQLKSRSRSALLWVIGNRRKFNAQGIVPVSRTGQDIMHRSWEDDWHALPLIKSLAALAGLFHDWGKASELFQAKLDPARDDTLKGDPLRHEWVSTLFLSALVSGQTDEQWLEHLAQGQIDPQSLMNAAGAQVKSPLSDLPAAAGLVGWLVLTHHRLSLELEHAKDQLGSFVEEPADLLKKLTQHWGYENRYEEAEFRRHVQRCFDYPNGLPDASKIWMKEMRRF